MASPPGSVCDPAFVVFLDPERAQFHLSGPSARPGPAVDVPYGPLVPYCHHQR
jgi:hypothetical protein